MNIHDDDLKNILLEGNYVTAEDIEKAEQDAGDTPLVEYLVAQDLVTPDLIGQAMAEFFEVPYADLNSHPPDPEVVRRIPEQVAREKRIVIFKEDDDEIMVATDEPEARAQENDLEELFDKKLWLAYALPEDIDNMFLHYRSSLETRFSAILEEGGRVAPEILDAIFTDAFAFEASDVHFEPFADDVRVRFRVDGVLQEAGAIPKQFYESIINRIKVMSNLRIDEHFTAQDGSMRYEEGERSYDIRTSIVPTIEGEKVVLRVLASYVGDLLLPSLGLTKENEEKLTRAARNPFGMILATGPTGSGKTTMLYALLRMLNTAEVNIMTIEEPVEYKLAGVNQIPVDRDNNLSFAKGLRSIVRQDPDIILVGEVRDRETAEIAVNAALTGHLMLSTFHSNDASTAIPRLADMGIEPFLLASTLELVVAQRLVRTICENCKYSKTVKKSDIKKDFPEAAGHFKESEVTLYEGKTCEVCNHTGYNGRTGVFEIIETTPEMQELILENPSTREVRELAHKQGMVSMFEDGIKKVQSGVTTLEELRRVVPSDDRKKKQEK